MRFRTIAALALIAAIPMAGDPALAQTPREAVSSTLSPEAAAAVFNDAVTSVCVPAVAGGGIPAGVRAKLQATTDPATRKQSGAAADETVWDVVAGKGVVTIRERPGRCVVSVYGPPASATIQALAQQLVGSGFERLAAGAPPNGFGQTLMRTGGKRMMATLAGSDPGMPGHQSRFSVVTATVFSAS
jgi:hypothetical protein